MPSAQALVNRAVFAVFAQANRQALSLAVASRVLRTACVFGYRTVDPVVAGSTPVGLAFRKPTPFFYEAGFTGLETNETLEPKAAPVSATCIILCWG